LKFIRISSEEKSSDFSMSVCAIMFEAYKMRAHQGELKLKDKIKGAQKGARKEEKT
jgi:hypothetical protein